MTLTKCDEAVIINVVLQLPPRDSYLQALFNVSNVVPDSYSLAE